MQEERDVDIKGLWKEAFGDDDEFISSFTEGLKGHYRRYTVIEKNRLLSILHVLSFEMDGFRIGYIYGVATLSEARKRGYASQLIKKAIDEAKKRDVHSGVHMFLQRIEKHRLRCVGNR